MTAKKYGYTANCKRGTLSLLTKRLPSKGLWTCH